jgi:hypothetical protein
MYQTIVDAMQALAEAGWIFGLESSKDGEREFQLAVCTENLSSGVVVAKSAKDGV